MDKLTTTQPLSSLLQKQGISTWQRLMHFLPSLPYGRNSNRSDLSLILTEGKGTCSSKHAFAKAVAIENGFTEVKLVLCLYKMNADNTRNIGPVLKEHGLEYIPEAHCYLMVNGIRQDLTKPTSSFARIENDLLHEEFILPDQVAAYKIEMHQEYLRKWVNSQPNRTFQEIWNAREACISALS